jgi:hypothetical protein
VRLEVGTTDAAGHRWRSSGEYAVGQDGLVLMNDAERPWWDMAFADPEAVPVAFTAPDTELRYDLSVGESILGGLRAFVELPDVAAARTGVVASRSEPWPRWSR